MGKIGADGAEHLARALTMNQVRGLFYSHLEPSHDEIYRRH